MKFREIFRFEFIYQVRRPSTWFCFAVLFAFTFWAMLGSTPSDSGEFLNAPFTIAFFTVIVGAIWLLIGAWVAGEAGARDVQTRMHPLTYTAPISKVEYLGGRFLAAFVINGLILLAVPAGILLAVSSPWIDSQRLAPFWPAAYLTAYGLIALPFAFVVTGIQFSSATLSRRPMASYLASVLLFIASTFVLPTVAGLLEWSGGVSLLDLVGITGIVQHLANAWTAAEVNIRLVGLEGAVVANRLIWLGIAAALLAFTYARFRLAHPAGSSRRRFIKRRIAPAVTPQQGEYTRTTRVDVARVRRSFGLATYARQTLGIASNSFLAIARSRAGLVLLAAIPALVVAVMPQSLELQGVPMIPRTGYVLTFLTAPLTDPFTVWVIVPLLLVLYAGELVWRERNAGLSDIADSTPVPEWSLFLGKYLGLVLVLVVWMAMLTLAGLLVQVRMGYYEFEIGLYLQVLFGLRLPEYLLFALLAIGVHTLVNQEYLGHLTAFAAYGYIAFAASLGIEHNLLVYGAGPEWSYTEMNGFGPSLEPALWFRAYWAGWALLLGVVATLFWPRGRQVERSCRLRAARRRLTPAAIVVSVPAVGLILILGGFIFYNTNVLNEYATASDWLDRRADYERQYGRYEGVPQPRLAGTDLHVEIYPDRRSVEVSGTYHLVNRSAVAIDSIHVATVPDLQTGAVIFDRPAARVLLDEELGHRIYTLDQSLQPGDSLRLSFRVSVEPHGFGNSGSDASVLANGTYFTTEDWLPAVGYQPNRELTSAGDRLARGLAPRPLFRSLSDAVKRADSVGKERIALAAVVGTDQNQIAVAPGALRATWTDRGRLYFRYSTDFPIANQGVFFSADYAVREATWNDVSIQIFHHPDHTANLDRMLRSARASLDYYTEQFGPYPHRQIRFVQHPGMGGMNAHDGVIAFQEGFFLFDVEENSGSPDFPFSVVAHEVAHQWWGSHLGQERVEGILLLSEALAEYSAWQVVEKTYGQEHLLRIITNALSGENEAARMRAGGPLLRATDRFLAYGKGAAAMYAVSQYVGEDRMHRALRRFHMKHRSGAPPLATSLDLYRELHAVTPDSLRYLLVDLFEANTFWEFEVEAATAEPDEAGGWRVTLDVWARKTAVDSAGVESVVPMDEDRVEIGVYGAARGGQPGEPLYRAMHRVGSGEQRITVTVPDEPARVAVDPRRLLIELRTNDNSAEVEQVGSAVLSAR